jgi:type I restriction enzyme, R subunit
MAIEPEIVTRKKRIDTRLKRLGWSIVPYKIGLDTSRLKAHAVEEYPTATGPADYALFIDGKLLGVIEAKKVTVATINALEQAKRYAKGVIHTVGNWNGYMVPFLYSSNGELVSFLDVRIKQNISRSIAEFHTPEAMNELFARNSNTMELWFKNNPLNNPFLRPYQEEAIEAIEETIVSGKRKMLVAMATGTGKTFTAVNSIYRLLETKEYKRILFLVDRKALAAQAAISFAAFETPKSNKFNQEYEVYSQRFKKDDLEEGEKFDVGVLPNEYLTKPDAGKTFVYVCTIQRMAINLLGQDAIFPDDTNDHDDDSDTDRLDVPIHAFDLIIADECHRGYTSKDTNVWRSVLDYFDAVKIGLTATPAAHTVSFFGNPVFRYTIEQAVIQGFLADYDAIKINSDIKINGLFLKEGEQVGQVDTLTGQQQMEGLEDERVYNATEVERKITAPDSNKKIIQEFAKYALAFEKEKGRFPKTLIFAVNDLQHTSHSDQIVKICKEEFNRGDDFVVKITGNQNVDRPLQKIKQFRNRPEPKIVISVDMLSTGVDIPALEYIIFMRPVKSRILWEQMLGRGTRLCPDINKDKFTIFDCFNGTLIAYFKDVTNFKFEGVGSDPVPIAEIIRRINDNEDREYNVNVFVKRLRRIEKSMSSEAREDFALYIPDGDVGKFADRFPNLIKKEFTKTMKILNNKDFQKLLVNYKRPKSTFVIAYNAQDEVSSEVLFEVQEKYLKPNEYLKAFSEFVKKNKVKMEAMKIILQKPKEWKTSVLKDLRHVLAQNKFAEQDLRRAHKIVYQKDLVDIISMIKHAVKEEEPILNINERVDNAILKVTKGKSLSNEQLQWIEYIKEHLIQNLTIDLEDFEYTPIFERHGGLSKFKKLFQNNYEKLILEINTAIAA